MLPASCQALEWGCREAEGSSVLAGIQNLDVALSLDEILSEIVVLRLYWFLCCGLLESFCCVTFVT